MDGTESTPPEEPLSWCTRCGKPTRWDGHQWVRDTEDEDDSADL